MEGMAGTGKSTLTRAICRRLHEEGLRFRRVGPTHVSKLQLAVEVFGEEGPEIVEGCTVQHFGAKYLSKLEMVPAVNFDYLVMDEHLYTHRDYAFALPLLLAQVEGRGPVMYSSNGWGWKAMFGSKVPSTTG